MIKTRGSNGFSLLSEFGEKTKKTKNHKERFISLFFLPAEESEKKTNGRVRFCKSRETQKKHNQLEEKEAGEADIVIRGEKGGTGV